MTAERRWISRRVVRTVAVIGLTAVWSLGLSAGTAPRAAAHADLLETSPANDALIQDAPSAVELRYTEAVQASAGGVSVFGPDGERVDRGSVQREEAGELLRVPVDAGETGTYTVAWRVTSEDGHTISGAFVFHLRRETGAADIDASTPASVEVGGYGGRWLAYAGSLVVLGALAVRLLGAGPQRRLRLLALVAAVGGVFGAGLALVASAAEAAGRQLPDGFSLLGDFVADQRTGTIGALRVATAAVVVVLVAVPALWRRLPMLPAAGSVAVVVVTSLGSHAWTTSPRWGAVASDVVHQLAVSVWVGGLVALLVALRAVSHPGPLARRFSTLALVAVGVVAVTGSISGWAQVRSLDALTTTSYGRLLLAKVAGFGILVGFGWRNRRRLVVALVEETVTPLLRSVRLESFAAAGVVAVTAALVAQPPARLVVARPFSATTTAGTTTLQVTVEPARTGANDIHMYFFTADGSTPATVDAVEVQAATGQIPPRRLKVTPVSPNHVSAYGASLTSPGRWTITIAAVRAGTPADFSIEVPIR